ncbi:hypothetical protein IWQ57_004317 [Coemansia nantahalensis]|uniref:Uncharacterized protein n=1 Tax=Coemansia nantahalensis TaxID=2789366 RepID=A0ACC1JSQ5_9FUNG|nr:hypothetical protein IWQ57_004317 [Coemansia nantahalensis]
MAMLMGYLNGAGVVTIDPGYTHLIVAVGSNGVVLKFSRSEDGKITKVDIYRAICEGEKANAPDVVAAEQDLSAHPLDTEDGDEFEAAIACRAKHRPTLIAHYGHDGPRTMPAPRGDTGDAAAAHPAAGEGRANAHAGRTTANTAMLTDDIGLGVEDPGSAEADDVAAAATAMVPFTESVGADPVGYAGGYYAGFLAAGLELPDFAVCSAEAAAAKGTPAYVEGHAVGLAAGRAVLSVPAPGDPIEFTVIAYYAGCAAGYAGGAKAAGQEVLSAATMEAGHVARAVARLRANPVPRVIMPAADCSLPGEPLYLKFAHNAYLNRQAANNYLRRKLVGAFGDGSGRLPLIVMGDFSAPTLKHQKSIRGSALCRDLVAMGFKVLLVDEFNTSKLCSRCDSPLFHLRVVSRARPRFADGREEFDAPCHGQLACASKECAAYVSDALERRRRQGHQIPKNKEFMRRLLAAGFKTPKRVRGGYNYRKATAFDIKNQRHGKGSKRVKGGRVRKTDRVTLPPNHPKNRLVRIVDRDVDAALSMMKIIRSIAEGNGYPVKYRRPKSKPKQPARAKGKDTQANIPAGEQPARTKGKRTCSTCGEPGHNRLTCLNRFDEPPARAKPKQPEGTDSPRKRSTGSQDDGEPRTSKRPRRN